MSAWLELLAALALFLVSHQVPAALGLKRRMVDRAGPRAYAALYSALSLALLYWLILAAGRAPFVPLWDQAPWHRWAVNLAMPLVGLLAVFGIGAPNPFAFEGRTKGFHPDRPGIAGLTRQPLLWALALWAGAHLLANGDLAHLILFAPLLALALAGMAAVERRRARTLGPEAWAAATRRTSLVPFAALLAGRWRPQGAPSPWRLALWAALWPLVWHLHAPVIGAWPGP